MKDDDSDVESQQSELAGADPSPHEPPNFDPLLRGLIAMVNQHPDNAFPMTITVAGGTVTGSLIQNKAWLDETLHAVARGAQVSPGEGVSALFKVWGDKLRQESSDDAPALDFNIGFVHLRNARFVTSTGTVPDANGFLWRGRLSEVSSWSLGTLGDG